MSEHCRAPVVSVAAIDAWRARRREWLSRHSHQAFAGSSVFLEMEKRLRRIASLLEDAYGSPHLGNWSNATDEFVYIVLSRKTAARAYQPAFESLKAVGDWARVARMTEADLASQIHGCGLERKKAAAILAGLRAILDRFGTPDLSQARSLTDDELFTFLASLPEVGPKSSRCVMLYSFGRSVFPVDAHVGRVLARLAVFQRLGIDLIPMGHKMRQEVLEDAIPPDIRYSLHVNLVAHGRSLCHARHPDCGACMLARSCGHARRQLGLL